MMSRNWTAIERLPEIPGVVKMTGNGYWLDGVFYPTRDGSPKGQDRNGLGSRRPGPEGVAPRLIARFVKEAKRQCERWGGRHDR
ncbi:hypothetical protein HDC35_000692 [Sphingopyxis sp. JAI128]|nr:hypothetical protein [Sphingopyxis sp. JAI128]